MNQFITIYDPIPTNPLLIHLIANCITLANKDINYQGMLKDVWDQGKLLTHLTLFDLNPTNPLLIHPCANYIITTNQDILFFLILCCCYFIICTWVD